MSDQAGRRTGTSVFRHIAGGVGGLLLLTGMAAAQTIADAEPPEALVKAAQAEGNITVYSTADENQSKTLLAAFEKRYGIKGTYLRFPTVALMQRFSTEYDGKSVRADILSVSSPVPYETKPDRFAKIDPSIIPNMRKWAERWVRPNYVTWTTDVVALVYNTDEVSKADVPKTWTDTADPKWKGKILLTDPQVADNYLGWLDAVERANGMEFLRKLAAQNYTVTQSGASGVQMVAAGAHALNMPTFAAFSSQLIAKKAPVAIQYLTGPMVASPRDIAVVAAAPNPNAARLYLNWLMSEEGIKLTCSISPTSVVSDPEGKLGCVPARNAEPMRFDVSDERKRAMAQALGVAR